jgi:cysteine desulfurase
MESFFSLMVRRLLEKSRWTLAGVVLTAQLYGGHQERGFRSGTLNVPGIVGFGKSAVLAAAEMESNMLLIRRLRDKLENAILQLDGTSLNGNTASRLATVSNISFEHTGGKRVLEGLLKEVAVSPGSACSSASPEPSHVLKAMGLNDESAFHSIRFSLGKYNTAEEVNFVVEKVKKHFMGLILK